MRLRRQLSRRLQRLLPPGLARAVLQVEQGSGWSASPLAALALGAAARCGCLRLTLDGTLVDLIRQRGVDALPVLDDGNWQALGRRGLRFKVVLPQSHRVVLFDALRKRLWLMWREPGATRCRRGY